MACGALAAGAAGLKLHFGEFQIPVAIVVPHEAVQGFRRQIKAVGFVGLRNLLDGLIQTTYDPHIGEGVAARLGGGCAVAAVLVFGVHQDEVGGVPDFVAEVAVAFGAFEVEVHAAAQAGVACHGEAQCIRAHAGDAFGEEFFRGFFHFRRSFGFAQAGRAFHQQLVQVDAVNQIDRVDDVAFGFGHFFAFVVAHDAVDVHVFKRHFAGEVGGHHNHARHPEEDDFVAGDQDVGRQEGFEFVGFRRPAERGERHERGGEPCVQYVFFAGQTGFAGLFFGFRLIAGNVHIACFVVPRGDLMAPPQLARDTPVLDVVHPLVVSVDPVFRDKAYRAAVDGFFGFVGEAQAFEFAVRLAAVWRGGHGDKPLAGQHRLNH